MEGIVTVTYRERREARAIKRRKMAQGNISLDFRSEAEVPCARASPVSQTGLVDRMRFVPLVLRRINPAGAGHSAFMMTFSRWTS